MNQVNIVKSLFSIMLLFTFWSLTHNHIDWSDTGNLSMWNDLLEVSNIELSIPHMTWGKCVKAAICRHTWKKTKGNLTSSRKSTMGTVLQIRANRMCSKLNHDKRVMGMREGMYSGEKNVPDLFQIAPFSFIRSHGKIWYCLGIL